MTERRRDRLVTRGWSVDQDAGIATLDAHGYDHWLVLEQDAITADEPTVRGGPMLDARERIAFLHHSAPKTQEVDL